ncbi:hypothetical protein BD408DRAFT_198107 [Parasitella parasitica]|nr:hypothetical protein BD408DRAFT_198107 [Parasitella parasitica]
MLCLEYSAPWVHFEFPFGYLCRICFGVCWSCKYLVHFKQCNKAGSQPNQSTIWKHCVCIWTNLNYHQKHIQISS